MRWRRNRQDRGAALITILLIIALATTLVVQLSAQQRIHLLRTTNLIHTDQSYHYTVAAEQWGRNILKLDRQKNSIDHLNEDWASTIEPIQVEGGAVWGQIDDLQGRLNLNSLISGNKLNGLYLEIFQRLLKQQELSTEIAYHVADWIDSDHESSHNSAMEPEEMGNQMMTDPSELMIISGIEYSHYQQLLPLVSTLDEPTAININTAPARLLEALHPQIDEGTAKELVAIRNDNPYNDPASFLQQLQQLVPTIQSDQLNIIRSAITTQSSHFQLTTESNIGTGRQQLISYLTRDNSGKTVVRFRTSGSFE